jgi:hypothetical protein
MSGYGCHLNKDVADALQQGKKEGLIVGLLIGCAFTALVCYQLFGPTPKLPNLSLLIGDMRRVKDDTEGIGYSIISRYNATIISDRQSREGAGRYHGLASRFNGISATLEAMLSTGHDDQSVETMRLSLSEAQQQYHDFRRWFDSLPLELPKATETLPNQPTSHIVVGALHDTAGPFVDLAKHFFDGMKEMDKIKRDHLISMIKDSRFKPWSEITNSVPSSTLIPRINSLRSSPPLP